MVASGAVGKQDSSVAAGFCKRVPRAPMSSGILCGRSSFAGRELHVSNAPSLTQQKTI